MQSGHCCTCIHASAIVNVPCRYAAENPSQASSNYLSLKVLALFREVLSTHTFPDLQRKLERFTPALSNSNALLLLRKGRKWVVRGLGGLAGSNMFPALR